MTDTAREIRNAVICAVVALVAVAWLCQWAKAEPVKSGIEVYEFGATWCGPCQQFKPTVLKVKAEGYAIRQFDMDRDKAFAKACHVSHIPCCIAIQHTAHGDFEVGRTVGVITAGQLRRLCTIPVATTVGAATRSAVRAAFGNPLLEW